MVLTTLQRLLALVTLCLGAPAMAIVNGKSPPANDTRFDAVAAFGLTDELSASVEFGDDPDDLEQHGHFGNGVLISPTRVVMAKHLIGPPAYAPAPGRMTFRFRRHVNGTVGSVDAGWQSFHQVRVASYVYDDDPQLDVVIAVLEEPVTHIPPATVASPVQLNLQGGEPAFLAAWGRDGDDEATHQLRVAISIVTDVICWPKLRCVLFPDWTEKRFAGGVAMNDSGGGLFVKAKGGSFRLIGVFKSTEVAPLVTAHHELNPRGSWICCPQSPTACADLTGDGVVTDDDLHVLLTLYGPCVTCSCPGDLTRDGVVNSFDRMQLIYQQGDRCNAPCHGDTDDDAVVGDADLALLLANWGPHPCRWRPFDLDCDQTVGDADLAALLANWGNCP